MADVHISNAGIEHRGESECLPFNADWFGQWPNGWMDESTGGLVPRAFSDRAVSGQALDGYTRFEATNTNDVLQYISPVFSVNAAESHTLYLEAKKLAGNVAMEVAIQCYSEGYVGSGLVVLKTAYDPTASFTHTDAVINPIGGANPAFPSNTTTAMLVLRPTVGTVGAVGIKSIYFTQTDLLANASIGAGGSGLHEGYFDGTKFYGSVFFAGTICELDTNGTHISNIPALEWEGANDPHEITGSGNFLYAAQWTAQAVQKYDKTLRTKVGSISLNSQVFSVHIYDGHVYASTVDGFLHRIRLSDFTLQNSWDIGFDGGTTQGTVLALAGSIWIHGASDGKVYRVHPTTGAIQATINPPTGMSNTNNYGFGALNGKLYVSYRTGIMAEIDPATDSISSTWQIQLYSGSQLKSDGSFLWFVAQEPTPALIRFNPNTGGVVSTPMRTASAGKWCEVVNNEIWCGGLDSGRIQRFAR